MNKLFILSLLSSPSGLVSGFVDKLLTQRPSWYRSRNYQAAPQLPDPFWPPPRDDPVLRAAKQGSIDTSRPRQKWKNKKTIKHKKRKVPQTWRIFGVEVHPDDLIPETEPAIQNKYRRDGVNTPVEKKYIQKPVIDALLHRLRVSSKSLDKNDDFDDWSHQLATLGITDVRVVRRSLDARAHQRRSDGGTGPRFVYVIDIDLAGNSSRNSVNVKPQPGRMELMSAQQNNETTNSKDSNSSEDKHREQAKKRVIIVGAGPAGLFCALRLAHYSNHTVQPILLERGQPVESRGKDIGALMHRRSMNTESNFAFGEGGAGTWSDGKLTTRIGRNSDAVRFVLQTLVEYGAPENILVEGSPHLGTDNLVRLLRNMRLDLRRLGGEIHFGTKVTDLIIQDGVTKGVSFETRPAIERMAVDTSIDTFATPGGETGQLFGDAVVLATGHSARDVYEKLHKSGVKLEAKGFAVGFRVEHPQTVINKIQYGKEWGPTVITGKKTTDRANQDFFESLLPHKETVHHKGRLPVPSYRLATDKAFDGELNRGAYSFCMCPGGQIVPASTNPDEVCVNGMSFSRRDSLWANSALVVTVDPNDPVLEPYRKQHGVLAGVAFQHDMERKASMLGGGKLTVPVQRVTDFLAGQASTTAPPSSYRLGVQPAPCHEIYPKKLTAALRTALTEYFDKIMPGFVCEDALLHAVETRTSSPVRVCRDEDSLQAVGAQGLFPAGEGAGFAGGIVSAAVDGMVVAEAVLETLLGEDMEKGQRKDDAKKTMKALGTFY